MTYTVKEIFYTIQGEGANLGRPTVFIRFTGCNLWSGREEDRATAPCNFCDTDFVGGRKWIDADDLADEACDHWTGPDRFCVLTGGEPLLQVDTCLIDALKARCFKIAIETNGTQLLPAPVDWICVSPKPRSHIVIDCADELKLVYPQVGLFRRMPVEFDNYPATYHWLSPMAGSDIERNTADAAAYCKAHPKWRLAIQAHKFWNIP